MSEDIGADNRKKSSQQDGGRLNSFLTELVNTQDNKLLSSRDMDELLVKYSLEPEDIEKLTMLIDRHLNRAFDYRQNERWDSAIVETERALLFAPLNNEIRLDLAELFLKRSVQYGYLQKDLDRAGREVSDALILEPENRAAKKFQKELKQLKQMLRGTHHNRKIIPLMLAVVLILGIALYPQIRKRFSFLSLEEGSTALGTDSPYIPPWETRILEVERSSSLRDEFNMELQEKILIRESPSGSPALSIAGYMEPLSDDYSQLELEVFRTDNNSSLGRIPVVSEADAPLRKGETGSFYDYMYLNDDLTSLDSVYIGISSALKLKNKDNPEWMDQIIHIETPLPNGVFLEAQSRFVSEIEGYDRNYLFFDLKVKNKGQRPLSTLDFSLQWRDKQGLVIAEQSLSLTEHESLPVKADSINSRRIMFNLNKSMIDGEMNILIKDVIKK